MQLSWISEFYFCIFWFCWPIESLETHSSDTGSSSSRSDSKEFSREEFLFLLLSIWCWFANVLPGSSFNLPRVIRRISVLLELRCEAFVRFISEKSWLLLSGTSDGGGHHTSSKLNCSDILHSSYCCHECSSNSQLLFFKPTTPPLLNSLNYSKSFNLYHVKVKEHWKDSN